VTTQTITTVAGRTYSTVATTGENGEVTYAVERVSQGEVTPVGSFVIHPDYNLIPTVPGLVNVQFGAGSATDRHQRTDVPVLGSASAPFVIGHQLVDPSKITEETPNYWLSRLAVASAPTGVSATGASSATAARTSDLITALVANWSDRKDNAKLVAQYEKFLAPQRAEAEAEAAATKKLTDAQRAGELATNMLSIKERITLLAKKLADLPEITDETSDEDKAALTTAKITLTAGITALQQKNGDYADEYAVLTK